MRDRALQRLCALTAEISDIVVSLSRPQEPGTGMASEAAKKEQRGVLQPLAAAMYAGSNEKSRGYMSAAVGGVVITLAMRQMDCGASAFSAFTCSLSLFCALVCFLHALLFGGLDVLEFLAEVVTTDMDIDDRVVQILKGELSKSILLEGAVAFYLTVTLDNLESYLIVQRLQVAVMVALSYKAVTIINALAALGLDVLGSTFNNNFILLMVHCPKLPVEPPMMPSSPITLCKDSQNGCPCPLLPPSSTQVRTITASVAILLVFENAGLKLTPVITSLGMGGILVAVSSQSLLQDVLASLTLVMDKPFEMGDFITAGGRLSGTVENIGLKTTQIRDPHGSLCIVPNRDLCNTAIDNFSHMTFRYE